MQHTLSPYSYSMILYHYICLKSEIKSDFIFLVFRFLSVTRIDKHVLFEQDDQGILYILSSLKHLIIFHSFWKANKLRKKNHTWSSCSKVYTPNLNALCFFLEHQLIFSPFVIIVYQSISCPQRKMKTKRNYIYCVLAFLLQNKRRVEKHLQ